MRATAWQRFVQGAHAWRGELGALKRLPPGDRRRTKTVKGMKQHVWGMSPDAPSLQIFGPPEVNQAAHALPAFADDITDDVEADRPIDDARVEQFDKQKWELVVLASSKYGFR
jgi:hypothetical protein